MVQLDKNAIDAIKKISDAIEGTGFYLNRFSVSDNYNTDRVITFDIIELKDTKMEKTE